MKRPPSAGSVSVLRALIAKRGASRSSATAMWLLGLLILFVGAGTVFQIGGPLHDVVVIALVVAALNQANEAFGHELDADNLRFVDTLLFPPPEPG